jgi:hypothetical protein
VQSNGFKSPSSGCKKIGDEKNCWSYFIPFLLAFGCWEISGIELESAFLNFRIKKTLIEILQNIFQ